MAKKKTENIKAAPVLRAQSGGEQPTPTPEQTGTRTYQIMDPWKDRGTVNLVDVKAVDGEITEVKVNGQPAGGGGGGDFSVAMVTFIDTNGNAYLVTAPFVLEGNEYINQDGILPGGVTPASSIYPKYFTNSFNDPVKVALYKNSAYIEIDGQAATVSGNATIIDPPGNSIIQITGDCTITIS